MNRGSRGAAAGVAAKIEVEDWVHADRGCERRRSE